MKDPFKVEHLRAKMAADGNVIKLRQMYTKKLPEIKDLNTAKLWDDIYDEAEGREPLHIKDGMTRDRVHLTNVFLPKSVRRVLDIGMGQGWVEEYLSMRGIDMYGIDISELVIKNIKKRFKGHFEVRSMYDLTYPVSFDAVLLLEVLEHVPPSKTFKLLSNIHKILTPNGYLVLSVPTNEHLDRMNNNPSGHVRMYTEPLICAELELGGFKVLWIKKLYAFNKWYKLKKFLAKFLNRWEPNNFVILAQKTTKRPAF